MEAETISVMGQQILEQEILRSTIRTDEEKIRRYVSCQDDKEREDETNVRITPSRRLIRTATCSATAFFN